MIDFTRVLYFPVTPFDARGAVDLDVLDRHLASRLEFGPGGVFPACGTGEFHALTAAECGAVISTTVTRVAGAVPVVAGTGGQLGHAREIARLAGEAGADALLVLPPYLVSGTSAGLQSYVESILGATDLPVIVYHRGAATYTPDLIRRLFDNPRVIGFKDGVGDIAFAQSVVRIAAESGRDDLRLFNGLLTAEVTQAAYRGVGIPLYSSAAFAMLPQLAVAYFESLESGDEATRSRLLDGFYLPLVRLRDETPGFGVSLIKAGIRLSGLDVGPVRAPLVDPNPDQLERLGALLDAGRALVDAP